MLGAWQTECDALQNELPASCTALIHQLLVGVSNDRDSLELRPCHQSLALEAYRAMFDALPEANRQAVLERWGAPEQDPMFRDGRLMIAGVRLGLTVVGIPPARRYQEIGRATCRDRGWPSV